MSVEDALIARAYPFMVAAKAEALIIDEVQKGCRPELCPESLSLEPYFQPIQANRDLFRIEPQPPWTLEPPPAIDHLVRLKLWISPEQKFDWKRSELFIKLLQRAAYRIGFEAAGNDLGVYLTLLCHRFDLPTVIAAFQGEFEFCELTPLPKAPPWFSTKEGFRDIRFFDYYPPPPYSHLLTSPSELHLSPLENLMTALSGIKDPAHGLYQILFQGVSPSNNWHRNVQALLDFEYALKLQDWFQTPQKYAQQAPSGDLRRMSWEVENKAHDDKPLYAVALRLAVFGGGPKGPSDLTSLDTFTSLFLHGGRPLMRLSDREYHGVLKPEQIPSLFLLGLTHRPGFLVTSWELTGLVNLPPPGIIEHRRITVEGLEILPVRNEALHTGTWIGTCMYAGESQKVCIPGKQRRRSTHLIGRSGMGKTSTQEHMILSDIEEGDGVAVLDPHGDLIERLLRLIPQDQVERTVYLNPGDPDWVPLWNPLERIPGQDIGRMADDLVRSIQSFVATGGWGDRMEHLLRHLIFALIHLPDSTFLDISNLLRGKSEEGKLLRKEILNVLDNESARQFWLHDYHKYGKDDFGPPRNKLSKLLVSGTVSLMLSQPQSRFNFRRIMDEGLILLINLSNVGSMVRGILGCFILSLLHLTALGRSTMPIEKRKQFHIHCDEAHRFMTDALEDLIAETRKYGVSLSLAHQYMSQFGKRKVDALSSVGSTIIFNVDHRDAQYLTKDLRGHVKAEDLTSLEFAQAVARIGTDIVRLRTRVPPEIPASNYRDRIVDESRRKYYRPAHEIRQWIRHRKRRWSPSFTSLAPPPEAQEELIYDEF